MPRTAGLLVAPLVGAIFGAGIFSALTGESAVLPLVMLHALYAYVVAALGLPLVYLLARYRMFGTREVYAYALLCAVPTALWLGHFGLREFAISAFATGLVAALTFNAIYFRRVAPQSRSAPEGH